MKQVTRHLCKSFFLTGRQTAVTCGGQGGRSPPHSSCKELPCPVVVADCPLGVLLAGQWWLSLMRAARWKSTQGDLGGWPCQWVGEGTRRSAVDLKEQGYEWCGESLQRHFQSRSGVSAACQSLYSTRQQVVRKSDPLWGSSLAFLTPRQPCG